MLAAVLAFFLKLAGSGVVDRVLTSLERRADSETERLRIRSLQETNAANNQRDVIVTGMQHRVFWIPWLMATVPLSAWFGWGVLDTLANGALPDVATLPPQLKAYADVVWSNVFYTGAAGLAAEALGAFAAKRRV